MKFGTRLWGSAAGLWGATIAAACRADEVLTPVLAQVVTSKAGKNYVVEALVTTALVGLAIWTICKTSNRV